MPAPRSRISKRMWPPAGATRKHDVVARRRRLLRVLDQRRQRLADRARRHRQHPIGDRGGDLGAHGDARSRRRRPPRSRPAPSTGTEANPSPAVSPGVGAHALDDRAAAIDLARGPAARPRPRAPAPPACATIALQIARDDRDRRQRRQQLVRRARRQRRQRRQPLLAQRRRPRRVQLALVTLQRAPDAQQEVDDERRGDAERDPHAAQVQAHVARVIAERQRLVRREQERRAARATAPPASTSTPARIVIDASAIGIR